MKILKCINQIILSFIFVMNIVLADSAVETQGPEAFGSTIKSGEIHRFFVSCKKVNADNSCGELAFYTENRVDSWNWELKLEGVLSFDPKFESEIKNIIVEENTKDSEIKYFIQDREIQSNFKDIVDEVRNSSCNRDCQDLILINVPFVIAIGALSGVIDIFAIPGQYAFRDSEEDLFEEQDEKLNSIRMNISSLFDETKKGEIVNISKELYDQIVTSITKSKSLKK